MSAPLCLRPENPAQAGEELRAAAAAGASILPCGRRSRLARHAPGAAPDRWLSLAGMQRVLRLDPEDQTCEVEAGVSLAALQAAAGERGLELGVAAPGAEQGTISGLFLAPDVSLLTGCWGPPRDQVLGAAWILADGSEVQSGARVVKSVAGYDVTRLFLGTRGRLAACARLILRLRPLPRRPRWYRGDVEAFRRLPPSRPLRLAFRPGAEDGVWAQADGLVLPSPWQEVAPEAGQAALVAALAAFQNAPERAAFAALDDALAGPGACDLLGRQRALPGGREAEPKLAAEPQLAAGPSFAAARAVVIPHRAPSPWLERVARACAPGWPLLGTKIQRALDSTPGAVPVA